MTKAAPAPKPVPDNGRMAVWTYGKFDPPCAADDRLFAELSRVAEKAAADWYGKIDLLVFPSRVDNDESVLAPGLRVHYTKQAFSDFGRVVDEPLVKDPFKALAHLVDAQGYKRLVAVFPADMAKKLKDLKKYTSDAKSFEIVIADIGDAPGTETVGALLSAADTDDKMKFNAAAPTKLRHSRDFMTMVQNGLARIAGLAKVNAEKKKAT